MLAPPRGAAPVQAAPRVPSFSPVPGPKSTWPLDGRTSMLEMTTVWVAAWALALRAPTSATAAASAATSRTVNPTTGRDKRTGIPRLPHEPVWEGGGILSSRSHLVNPIRLFYTFIAIGTDRAAYRR